jgi:hypothetical protein
MDDAGTLLRRLIEKHFSKDGTWKYIEDTSIADVDLTLHIAIQNYLLNSQVSKGTAQ